MTMGTVMAMATGIIITIMTMTTIMITAIPMIIRIIMARATVTSMPMDIPMTVAKPRTRA